MPVNLVKHPLIRHKIGLMREHDVSTKNFRELANELATLLTYEATKDLETETMTIQGWAGSVAVEKIKGKKITVVPILRAGLGMMDGVLDLIPSDSPAVPTPIRTRTGAYRPLRRRRWHHYTTARYGASCVAGTSMRQPSGVSPLTTPRAVRPCWSRPSSTDRSSGN